MATCVVTLAGNTAAISEAVRYEALPNQAIDGVFVDTSPILASASGTSYAATLIRKASYRLISNRFDFDNTVFEVPDAATADLDDLLTGLRLG